MQTYLQLLNHVLTTGRDRSDRTGVGTRSVFGAQMRHNMAEGFPLLTTKKVHFKSIVVELLWFLRGDTNVKYLQEHGVTIWNEWADANGELGPVYGKQWRKWQTAHGHIDQIEELIYSLNKNPFSRRHIVSAWNPADVANMALPPCHTLWQCYVQEGGCQPVLSLHLYARSIDIFLGLPFNIASYALLLKLLAACTGMTPGELIISFGDLHLYANHFEQAKEQLIRHPRPLPILEITSSGPLDAYNPSDFRLVAYDPHPAIKAPIAV